MALRMRNVDACNVKRSAALKRGKRSKNGFIASLLKKNKILAKLFMLQRLQKPRHAL
jgi:hypothetical protein